MDKEKKIKLLCKKNIATMEFYGNYFYNVDDKLALDKAVYDGVLKKRYSYSDDNSKLICTFSERTAKILKEKYDVESIDTAVELNDSLSKLLKDSSDKKEKYIIGTSKLNTLYSKYLYYNEIKLELKRFATDYPNFCSMDFMREQGYGSQGVDSLQIAKEKPPFLVLSDTSQTTSKIKVLITSGVHGDEWFAIHCTMELVKHLISKYLDIENNDYLKDLEIIIAPVINTDGYQYNLAVDRSWRKNLYKEKHQTSYTGIDINRNFPIYFGWECDTRLPDSETFRGLIPCSEGESKNIRYIFDEYKDIKVALDIHCDGTRGLFRPQSCPQLDEPFARGTRKIAPFLEKCYNELESAFQDTFNSSTLPVSTRIDYMAKSRGNYSGTIDEFALYFYDALAFTFEVHTSDKPDLNQFTEDAIVYAQLAIETLFKKAKELINH